VDRPKPRSTRWATLWLALVIGALLAGAYLLWTQDTRQGTTQPLYSVSRTDDRGAAVVYRLYEKAGLKPRVWDLPLTRLKEPGVLLLLEPARPSWDVEGLEELGGTEGDLLPDEIRALDAWVQQGNVAVILSRDYNDLFHALGLIVDEPKGLSANQAQPAQVSALAVGVNGIQTHANFGFKYGRKNPKIGDKEVPLPEPPIPQIPAESWLELFVKKDGQRSVPQVVSAARGKGLYVAVNDVFPATNLGVTQADDARFMLNLAALSPGGTVWFDEYHKRTVNRGLVSYMRERALMPALVYGLLLVLLVLWRSGTRFGSAEPLVADRRRDSAEYLKAAAALYKNAGMTRGALAAVFADFRRRLAGALRMDGLANLDEVARRYERRTGRPGLEARQLLIEIEALLARPKITEAEAVHAVNRLTHLDQILNAPAAQRKLQAPPDGR
jgi:hypothetical protein